MLRQTIDQLLDGENTGRYDWQDLHKTEKTHAGTLVEINLQREFRFASHAEDDTIHMDYLIEGIEVDCKYSQRKYGWMIPPEALGEICLVVWADDSKSRWSAGLLRADRAALAESEGKTKKGNRDGKFSLTRKHHGLVTWLWDDMPLKENLLLHLDEAIREAIMDAGRGTRPGQPAREKRWNGQAAVNELFSLVHHRIVDRSVVRTLARQYDYMARIRMDKGNTRARPKLRQIGIIILGQDTKHARIAGELGLPVPGSGEFVAARVRRVRPGDLKSAKIDGGEWTLADGADLAEVAPRLP
ncbi:NaeI family type II restriction endonuclease [Kitasatospora purpeofusca]|uniref:NaeI family type II restriction endonuclease n=1 Tax=Kitasatospora purpeofusca TaxID=67352 RepID=UPI0033DE09C2